MDIRMRFGQKIKIIRKKYGISQEAFAAKCGIHRTHMGLIENGKTNITIDNIEKISKELGLTLEELFKDL